MTTRPTRERRGAARGVAAALALCLTIVAVPVARASVVVPLTLPQLVEAADVIADGEVLAVHVAADRGHIERIVTIRVADAWKGEAGDVLHLRLPGGELGLTREVVPGAPEVQAGDRLVWFLTRDPRGALVVVGLHQGAVRVVPSPAGRAMVGPAFTAGQPGAVIRGRVGGIRPLTTLRTEVRALVEAAP